MTQNDLAAFQRLLTDAMAFYRQDVSKFALSVWWEACRAFDIEQVSRALTKHAMDPERGQFAPKPADLIRTLSGTQTDRALVAWGKVFEAMSSIGSYSTVAFDDAVIHAVIADLGGWPVMCRTGMDEMPHLQRRFCEFYRAYARREHFDYPRCLQGLHAIENASRGRDTGGVRLIGDEARAQLVYQRGGQSAQAGPLSIGSAIKAISFESEKGAA